MIASNYKFTSVSVLVSRVVSPDGQLILDILIQIIELLHVVLFQRGAVFRDIHNVEETELLHGLEEEGVNVGVVVEEVHIGDPGDSIKYSVVLFRPQPDILESIIDPA